MSTSADDGMTPITRRDLNESLSHLLGAITVMVTGAIQASEGRLRSELSGAIQALRGELRGDIQASEERLRGELRGDIQASEERLRGELRGDIQASEERLMHELGAHTRASTEELTARIRILDDKYADLPARVTRLEELAAAPVPGRRRRRS